MVEILRRVNYCFFFISNVNINISKVNISSAINCNNLHFQSESSWHHIRYRNYRQDPVGAARLSDCRLVARLLYHPARSTSER